MDKNGRSNTNFERMVSRRSILKSLAAVPLVVAGGSMLSVRASAESDIIQKIQKRGYVIAGFYNEKPAAYADKNRNLTGIFPAVARPILKEDLGITEIQPVITQWQSLIPGLKAKRFDMIIAGMFILPERCKEVLFTDPFRCTTEALVFPKNNPYGIKSYQDVAANTKVRLGLVPGSSQAKYAKAFGVSNLQNYPDPLSGLEALNAGRIDVWAGPTAGVKAIFDLEGFDESGLTMVSFVPVIEGKKQLGCGGFAFRKSDERFHALFNKRINEWKTSGKLYSMISEWVSRAEFDASMDITAGQLCQR